MNARSASPTTATTTADSAIEAADPAALLPGERGQPAERVRRDRKEVVTKREQLAARRRLAAEHVLRDQPVDDDHDRVASPRARRPP